MSYSSPIAYMVGGARQVAFFTAYALVGLSPQDGKLLWRFPWKTRYDVSAATPIFMPPDRIFISSGGDGAVVRVKEDGVEQVWKNSEMKNHFGTSVYLDGYLYGFDESILKCIDAQTGEEKWKARGYAKGTLIAADGYLIVLGEQGNLGLVEATPEGFVETAGFQVMNARCWTAPSLADGTVYLRDESEIVAVDLRGGVE
jgi:outer membrane protein assembly factor BamB